MILHSQRVMLNRIILFARAGVYDDPNSSSHIGRSIARVPLPGLICVLAAACFGMYGAYVDQHNATEVYPVLLVTLVGSLLLGLAHPRHVWRWALIVAALVPFSPLAAAAFPARLALPGSWAIMGVVLIPALIGAYAGWGLRKAAGAAV